MLTGSPGQAHHPTDFMRKSFGDQLGTQDPDEIVRLLTRYFNSAPQRPNVLADVRPLGPSVVGSVPGPPGGLQR